MSQDKKEQERINEAAWFQTRGAFALMLGLGTLGAILFGPFGFFAGLLIGRALAPTDKIHL